MRATGPMKRTMTPRQAMSARQVDRVEREIVQVKIRLNRVRFSLDHALVKLQKKLTRLLASVRRSERR